MSWQSSVKMNQLLNLTRCVLQHSPVRHPCPTPMFSRPLRPPHFATQAIPLRRAELSVRDWLTLYRANIEVESAYRQDAVSSAGAIGLGQLMPATARVLDVDPHDPLQNLDGSARYLAMMLETFGDPRLALAAYNAGPDAVRQYGGIPPYRETQNHVARVMAGVARLEGSNS